VDDDARERIKQLLLSDPDAPAGYFVINDPTSETPSIEWVACQVPGCVATAVETSDGELLLCHEHFDERSQGSS
jgi:hypothetical protein